MQKQLVVQLARFGDILQSRRLIKSLQLKGEVALCVDKSQLSIANCAYPDIEVIPLEAFNANKADVFVNTQKSFDYIQAQNFDSVYTMNATPLSYAIARLFEEEQVFGYSVKNGQELRFEWSRFAFLSAQNRFQAPLHLIDYWAYFADEVIEPNLVNPSALAGMKKWQEGRGNFRIGVVLSGQNARRAVPVLAMAQIVNVLASRFEKVEFHILGTAKEQNLAEQFLVKLPPKVQALVKNLIGKTNIQELFKEIKDCDLLLSPDTGALHCAAFQGVPTLSFFCSSAWCFETGAYGEGHVCIQAHPNTSKSAVVTLNESMTCAPCAEAKPCNKTICHEVFSAPALLARLAKAKTQKVIENFSILESSFDEVGLDYSLVEGVELERTKAKMLRKLLYEYHSNKVSMPHNEAVQNLASQMFDNISMVYPKNSL